jgi:O-antigen/teichoic acid export membrane protein
MINKFFQSSLFKASGAYTLFSFFNSSISFLMLPILTRYLTPEDYGIVAMFSLLLSIVGVFTGLSVYGAIHRVYFEKEINFKEYVANCMYILIFSSAIVFVVSFVFLDYIAILTNVPKEWILVAIVISFFQFVTLSNLAIYQAQLKSKQYGFIQIGQGFLNAFLTIIFVAFLTMKWDGRLLSQFLATVVFGVFSYITIYNYYSFWKFNKQYVIHALRFGLPLIPHTIGGMFMLITDRLMINNLIGIREVGIYTAGLQIGMIIELLASSFNKAWGPWLFNRLNENKFEVKLKIVKFTYIYFVGMILLSIILGLSSLPIVKLFLGKSFYEAKDVIFWIALGGAFSGMYYMVVNYIFYSYKTHILALITFLSGILNIPATYFFIKINGYVGASQAYAIINFITFIWTWILSQKVYKMPWRLNCERVKEVKE